MAKFLTGLVIGAAIGAAMALVVIPMYTQESPGTIWGRLTEARAIGQESAAQKQAEMWSKFREQTKLPPKN